MSKIMKDYAKHYKQVSQEVYNDVYSPAILASYDKLSREERWNLVDIYRNLLEAKLPEEDSPHTLIRKVASGNYILDVCLFKNKEAAVKRAKQANPDTDPIPVMVMVCFGPNLDHEFIDWEE